MSPLKAWIFLACHAIPQIRFITFHMEVAVSLLKGVPEWKIVYLKPSLQGKLAAWPHLCGWQDLSATNTPWVSKEIQYIQRCLLGHCITQVMPRRKDESHIILKNTGLLKALIPFMNLGYSLKKRALFRSRTEVPSSVTNWHLQVLPEFTQAGKCLDALKFLFFFWQMTSYMLENEAW